MMNNVVTLDIDSGGMPDPGIREEILGIEDKMKKLLDDPGQEGIGENDNIRHIFAPGVYAREITIYPGEFIVGKLHKTSHINIISEGDISVKTEFGTNRYKAPYSFVSQVGTKRVVFAHEKTIWTTIHPTEETDLEKIEDHVIAKSYDEIPGLDGPCEPEKIGGGK